MGKLGGKYIFFHFKQSEPTFSNEILNSISSSEAATGDVLWKKVFLKISQISQKNTGVFLWNLRIFFRRPILKNIYGWLTTFGSLRSIHYIY